MSAKLNSKIYEKGQAVTDEEMDLLISARTELFQSRTTPSSRMSRSSYAKCEVIFERSLSSICSLKKLTDEGA